MTKTETRIIHCQDCGTDYETTRANTKVCRVCRVYRDLAYMGDKTKRCMECERSFLPLKQHEILCGSCDFIMSKKYVKGECAICQGTEHMLLDVDIHVCLVCAKSASRRKEFLAGLKHKRHQRQAAP